MQDALQLGYLAIVAGILLGAEASAVQARCVRDTLACGLALALAACSRGGRPPSLP